MSYKRCCVPGCVNSSGVSKVNLHKFPNPDKDNKLFNTWVYAIGGDILKLENSNIYKYRRVCHVHFDIKYWCRYNRITKDAVPTKNLPGTSRLEVCIDNLESARNAINGGADELEVCSSLAEGGLTPSPGLVKEILKLEAVINVMIRCRGGSDFCYADDEMTTMLSDIEIYKHMGVNRFVFGALSDNQAIDKVNCARIIDKAHPIPVTFHRAFDVCQDPEKAIEDIIELGFNRLLTSGQKSSAADGTAVLFLKKLLDKYGEKIEIMPGAGINCNNADIFCEAGFKIIHSTCKNIRILPNKSSLSMGGNEVYVTDESIVRKIKSIIS